MGNNKKILVITRGDFVTRLILNTLLTTYPIELLHVIIVSTDSNGRSGLTLLKSMWREYEWHYFLFELYQFIFFNLYQKINPEAIITVQSLCGSYGINTTVVEKINSHDVTSFASHWQPDIIVSAKCPQRIGEALLSQASMGAINIHGSNLPVYAGRAPHFWAMCHGEKELGSTAHYMGEDFDAGDILSQKKMDIPALSSVFTMITSVARLGDDVLMDALSLVFKGAEGRKQNNTERSYFSSPTTTGYRLLCKQGYCLLKHGELLEAARSV